MELEREGKTPFLDLSVNLNPWGPPAIVRKRWAELYRYVGFYPPLRLSFYQEAIAKLYSFSSQWILPTNGATQGIYLLGRILPVERVLIVEPCFTEYRRAFLLGGKRIIPFLAFPSLDPERMEALLTQERIEAVVFGNPSNPLGRADEVSLYHSLRRKEGGERLVFIVDEAFQEFMGEETSLVPWVERDTRLYVIRSLTKYYALPGLRGGFIVTHPANVRALEEQVEPWSINSLLAQILLLLGEEDFSSFHRETAEKLKEEKRFLEKAFSAWSSFWDFFPSLVNFYTLRSRDRGEDFFSFLSARKVVVRRLGDFLGLGEQFFRIAVRTRRENQIFLEVVEEFVRQFQ